MMTLIDRCSVRQRLMWDDLPMAAAGLRFRFSADNPAAPGQKYAQSLCVDLPYMVGVLVR